MPFAYKIRQNKYFFLQIYVIKEAYLIDISQRGLSLPTFDRAACPCPCLPSFSWLLQCHRQRPISKSPDFTPVGQHHFFNFARIWSPCLIPTSGSFLNQLLVCFFVMISRIDFFPFRAFCRQKQHTDGATNVIHIFF